MAEYLKFMLLTDFVENVQFFSGLIRKISAGLEFDHLFESFNCLRSFLPAFFDHADLEPDAWVFRGYLSGFFDLLGGEINFVHFQIE